jgi:hypothetical protein
MPTILPVCFCSQKNTKGPAKNSPGTRTKWAKGKITETKERSQAIPRPRSARLRLSSGDHSKARATPKLSLPPAWTLTGISVSLLKQSSRPAQNSNPHGNPTIHFD